MLHKPSTGTYSSFNLSDRSCQRLHNWGVKAGIKNLYDKEEFHITICYSTKPVPFQALGLLPPMPVKAKGFELFGKEKQYLVAEVICPFAANRNEYAKLIGAVSDFPDYKPHISLAEDHGLKSVDSLPPIDFILYLKEEVTKDLDPDWSSKKKVNEVKPEVKRLEAYLKQVGNFTGS